MTWHYGGRPKDGLLHHTNDSKALQYLNEVYYSLQAEIQNIIWGFSNDRFNLFRNTNQCTCSTIFVPYNLAPWMFMKKSYFVMSKYEM